MSLGMAIVWRPSILRGTQRVIILATALGSVVASSISRSESNESAQLVTSSNSTAQETAEKQSGQIFCLATAQLGPKYSPIGERYPSRYVYALIKSNLPEAEITRQWTEFVQGQVVDAGRCSLRSEFDIKYTLEQGSYMYRHVYEKLAFVPKEVVESKPSRLLRKTIPFRDPQTAAGENGFAGTTFDVEYQFLACSGELHIAYSLVENSVGIGRLVGGGDRLLTSDRSGRATYWHEGQAYKVRALPETILNLPLKGSVRIRFQDTPLGTFADDHAGKALGFGCFSGQTKKVASLKDLNSDLGKEPTKEELAKLFDQLRVEFKTVQMLTSSAAVEEIESGLAQKAADDYERSGQANLDAATQDRARRKAEREAEFAAKQAKYEQELAAQQKAVADYEAAQRQMEADKAAASAKTQAAQEEFARKQAAHQAELDRYARERAEYEAKVAAQGSTSPQN